MSLAGGPAPAGGSGADTIGRIRWALMFGNFVIGCGVMVVAGSLNDIVRSLQVSVALGGQLISIAAVAMALGAPVLAAWLGGFDRRRLLVFALVWYAAGHALCAAAPDFATLTPVRAAAVLAAAVFTPQAAAAIGWLAPPEQRGRAITFIFLGWSVASVLGMPLHSFIGETFGWRWAFALVAVLAVGGAAWVWQVMPDGVRPPPLNLAAWKVVFTRPALMAIVAVTALSGAGQFTLFSYMAPCFRQVLQASPLEISLLFAWFGAFGLIGNVLLTRHIDQVGASRAVAATVVSMTLSLLLWPFGTTVLAMALVLIPWGLGCFASNSAQQARLGIVAPALAPALMALNTSAIYVGQAVGAGAGGAMVAARATEPGISPAATYAALPWVGLVFMSLAVALSVWASRALRSQRVEGIA
jgi:predicted MFS family arabinose efflux permease